MSLCSIFEQSDVGLASVADSLYRQGGEAPGDAAVGMLIVAI